MFDFVPKKLFFTKGMGVHDHKLVSFELALRDAKIEKYNLVTVSSILPPGCKIIERDEGIKSLKIGQILYCVLARISSNKAGSSIASSVGCATMNEERHGYLSEYESEDVDEKVVGKRAEELAKIMLETTFGNDLKGPCRVQSHSQYAEIKSHQYTTVISAGVFLF